MVTRVTTLVLRHITRISFSTEKGILVMCLSHDLVMSRNSSCTFPGCKSLFLLPRTIFYVFRWKYKMLMHWKCYKILETSNSEQFRKGKSITLEFYNILTGGRYFFTLLKSCIYCHAVGGRAGLEYVSHWYLIDHSLHWWAHQTYTHKQ